MRNQQFTIRGFELKCKKIKYLVKHRFNHPNYTWLYFWDSVLLFSFTSFAFYIYALNNYRLGPVFILKWWVFFFLFYRNKFSVNRFIFWLFEFFFFFFFYEIYWENFFVCFICIDKKFCFLRFFFVSCCSDKHPLKCLEIHH